MSELLTEDQYGAIAAEMAFPTGAWINGKAQSAASGERFTSVNPANGEVVAEIACCGEPEVNLAVEKAREAFDNGAWSRQHPSERKKALIQLVKLIKRHRHELAVLESLESGKPVSEVENTDIPESLHCLEWHAELADKIYDQVAPSGDDHLAMIVREPIGVVAAVLPWNFPILMLAWKLGPALAAGNCLIVKPAEETSMTALRIADLAHEAGIPRGVFSVVTGEAETGRLIGLHPDIDMVSFTGSTEVGKLFLKYAADSNMKRVVLECGGKNPCIVMEDAENLDLVAQHVTNAVFWNMGENCSSNSRLIVHESVREALMEKIAHRVRDWRTGRPLDPANNLGALISKTHYEKVLSYIEIGRQQGAEAIIGGNAIELDGGYYVEPTVFAGVSPEMRIAKEEIFGPVLAVLSVTSEEQAIAIANDSCYGLTASVFTANVRRAHRMARNIRAGTVTVNCFGEGDISTPFGGYKQSGFGGRDNSIHAHDQYTELKTIWVDLSDPSQNSLD